MTLLLFDRIDEPGLNTLPVYERQGGYQALGKELGVPTPGSEAVYAAVKLHRMGGG